MRGRGGCNSAAVSSPQQHILVLEHSRHRTKRCRGRAGLRHVSTPSGNRREQKSHRKPHSHGAADLTMLQLCCPTGQVHPTGTVGTWGHCSDTGLSQAPPLALEGQRGVLAEGRANLKGYTCLGRSCQDALVPFPADPRQCSLLQLLSQGLWFGWGLEPGWSSVSLC